jgi:hypothetical protein
MSHRTLESRKKNRTFKPIKSHLRNCALQEMGIESRFFPLSLKKRFAVSSQVLSISCHGDIA